MGVLRVSWVEITVYYYYQGNTHVINTTQDTPAIAAVVNLHGGQPLDAQLLAKVLRRRELKRQRTNVGANRKCGLFQS